VAGFVNFPLASRAGGDAGKPITVSQPDSPEARVFHDLAKQVAAKVSVLNFGRKTPGIISAGEIPVIKR